MSQSILVVHPPDGFRNSLVAAMKALGAEVTTRDDSWEALAARPDAPPRVVLVSDQPGPPGAGSLCRILERVFDGATVYRLGDPVDERPAAGAEALPRGLGADNIATVVCGDSEHHAPPLLSGWESRVETFQVGQVLIALAARYVSGRLSLHTATEEREVVLIRGMPVLATSTVVGERLGELATRDAVLGEQAVADGLRLARAEGIRLGEAWLRQGAIDGAALYRLLARQTLERLSAACRSGPWQARFTPDDAPDHGIDLFRTHPMTALVHAVSKAPRAELSASIAGLSTRSFSVHATPAIEIWMEALGVSDPRKVLEESENFGSLCNNLFDAIRPDGDGQTLGYEDVNPNALGLALVAAGALRFGTHTATSPPPSLVPPRASVMPAPTTMLHTIPNIAHWHFVGTNRPVPPAADAWERALAVHLWGEKEQPMARACALLGAEAEVDDASADFLALYLRTGSPRDPRGTLGAGPAAHGNELKLAYHRRLAEIASHESTDQAWLGLKRMELRGRFDRALAAVGGGMPSERDAEIELQVPPALPPPAPPPPSGESASATHAADPTKAASDQVLRSMEPFLEQGRWSEVLSVLAEGQPDPKGLPPRQALLYAIAAKEAAALGQVVPAGISPDAIGIAAMGQILGVPQDSAAARIVAKRTLRKGPLTWQEPPTSRVSVWATVIALAIGAGVGLAFSTQIFEAIWK